MFFPKRMKDLTIIVHEDYIQKVVNSLQEEGVVEINSIDRDEDVEELVEKEEIPEAISDLTEYEMELSSVLDIFKKAETEESEGLKELLNPTEPKKIAREKKTLTELFDEIDKVLEENGEDIKELDSKFTKLENNIAELRKKEEALKAVLDLSIDLELLGESTFSIIQVGKTRNMTALKRSVNEIEESFCIKVGENEEEYLVLTGAYLGKKREFESALREGDFRPLILKDMRGTSKEALGEVETELKKYGEKREKLLEKLKEYKEEHEKRYLVLKEELEVYRKEREISQYFGSTDTTSVIKAWTPEDKVEQVEDIVTESAEGHGEIIKEEPADPDEVPISLENPKPIKPFELLTKMFAPPRYDEVDPTFIVAPAFVLFFGLMLGDLIYGLVIAVSSLVIIKGPGKVDKGTKNFGWIMLATGLSTIFFGALQGGYLGPGREDYRNLLGRLGVETPALLETLQGEGPLVLLLISLIIGLTYINIGLILQLVQHIKRKDYRRLILENGSWWLLQPSGFILISGLMFEWYEFTNTVYYLSYGAGILGLILLGLRAKGLSFFELTGFIGDFLSFSRILALGLATAGIALTVNVIADLVAGANLGMMIVWPLLGLGTVLGIVGLMKKDRKMMGSGGFVLFLGGIGLINPSYPFIILAFFVFFAGHVINLALQGLGSFVHSLRLQYVEFFGYFFEGGGEEFEAFGFKRKHTKLKSRKEMKEWR
ncbi:MAG: V-type ATP synthase subunit I [Thermoplasmata archaeon]